MKQTTLKFLPGNCYRTSQRVRYGAPQPWQRSIFYKERNTHPAPMRRSSTLYLVSKYFPCNPAMRFFATPALERAGWRWMPAYRQKLLENKRKRVLWYLLEPLSSPGRIPIAEFLNIHSIVSPPSSPSCWWRPSVPDLSSRSSFPPSMSSSD